MISYIFINTTKDGDGNITYTNSTCWEIDTNCKSCTDIPGPDDTKKFKC